MTRLPKEELGLGDPPMRRWLYVGQDEGGSGSCWYTLDFEQNEKGTRVNVMERSLRGYITGIRAVEKNMGKHGLKWKFELFIDGDVQYGVRAGLETQFTRNVILALAAIDTPEDLTGALYLVVSPSKQEAKIVFAAIHLPNGQKVKAEWDKTIPIVPMIENLQSVLGDGGGAEVDDQYESSPSEHRRDERPAMSSNGERMINDSQLGELRRLAGLQGWDEQLLNDHCASFYNGLRVDELTVAEAVQYRQTLAAL